MTTVLSPPKNAAASDAPAIEPAPADQTPAKQGVLTVLDQAVVSLASFLGSVFVGQVGKGELGVYTLGVGTFWLIVGVPNALIWVPYTSRASRMTDDGRRRFAASCARMSLAIAGGMCLGALVGGFASWAATSGDAWLAPMLLAMAPLALTLTLREHVRRVLCADFRALRMLLLDLPICLIQIAGLAVLWGLGRLSAESAMLITALSASVSVPWVLTWAAEAKVSSSEVWREARSNWGFGRWLLIVAVSFLLSDSLLRWLLALMHGAEAIGQFGAVLAIVMLVNPLLLAMNAFARSWAARVYGAHDDQALLRHTRRTTLASSGAAIVLVVFLTLVGDFLVRAFFGPAYSAPVLLAVVALSICLQGAAIPVQAAFAAMEQGRRMSLVAMARLTVSVVVGVPLVYLLGPMGVAWAMVARSLAAIALSWGLILWGAPMPRFSAAEGATQA